jgi:hypothetical protein
MNSATLLGVVAWTLNIVITKSTFDISINGFPNRIFTNNSFGLEYISENTHQCISSGTLRRTAKRISPDEMTYTPNRKPQDQTIQDAIEEKLQLGIILALGGTLKCNIEFIRCRY